MTVAKAMARVRSALGCGAAIVPMIAGLVVIHLAGLDGLNFEREKSPAGQDGA
jgi:hypothetical protein